MHSLAEVEAQLEIFDIRSIMKSLIAVQMAISFTSPTEESEASGMGMIVARTFGWDGVQIMEAFAEALEDANFHKQCEKVREMLKELKSE